MWFVVTVWWVSEGGGVNEVCGCGCGGEDRGVHP